MSLKFSKQQFVSAILLLSITVGVSFLLITRNKYGNTPQPEKAIDHKKYEKMYLKKLATEVQVSYFKNILGDPVFINFPGNVNYPSDRSQKEYVFVNKLFYVQAITNPDDKVLAYSITTRDMNFNPELGVLDTKALLGKTKIIQLSGESNNGGPLPERCFGFSSGATARSSYFEEFYFGNPGNYQTYLYGMNDAGYWDRNHEPIDSLNGAKVLEFNYNFKKGRTGPVVYLYECGSVPQELRNGVTVNTYMVLAPQVKVDDLLFHFGAGGNQVRLLE